MAMSDEETKALKQAIQLQQDKVADLNRRADKLRVDADNLNAEARGINIAIDGFSLSLRRLEEEAKRKAETQPQ